MRQQTAKDKQLVEMLCIGGKKRDAIHHGAFEAQVFLLYHEITSNEIERSIVPSSVPQYALKCRALHSNCFANLNIRSLCLPQCQ